MRVRGLCEKTERYDQVYSSLKVFNLLWRQEQTKCCQNAGTSLLWQNLQTRRGLHWMYLARESLRRLCWISWNSHVRMKYQLDY